MTSVTKSDTAVDLEWLTASKGQTKQVAASIAQGTPARRSVVATVGTDGTITTTDGITAMRLAHYASPAVDDVISLTQTVAGGWIATDLYAAPGLTGWQPLTLASGWMPQGTYWPPSYRLEADGTASLCGLAQINGALTAGATIATLPAAATPAKQVRVTVQVATGYFGVMTILTGGGINLNDFTAGLPTSGNKYLEFDAFSHYRLA